MSTNPLAYLLLPALLATQAPQRPVLDAEFLRGAERLEAPVPTRAFEPGAPGATANRFEGKLALVPVPGHGGMEVHTDWFGYAARPELELGSLPAQGFDIVQDGNDLIPTVRVPIENRHPHWEFSLGPGRAWDEPGDDGWTRAALPFALLERNANCTHNGLLSFLFRDGGEVSRVAYQLTSETCQYFQADLWGTLEARYAPGTLATAQATVAEFRAEVAARLPVHPLSALERDYPGARADRFDWYPEGEVTSLGFAIDGKHYRGDCDTRYGPYPFCGALVLPSYSLAKSIFAGLAWMILEQERPGTSLARAGELVPECSGERWGDVTLEHLIDMTTGNYESLEPDVDEFASYETDFMAGETHADKIGTACTLFPRKAEPGSRFAYHTSDTYIAGTVMNLLLAQSGASAPGPSADIHRDVLVRQFMAPMGLSALTRFTRRSYDEVRQPFTGYGLALTADDIARIGLFLAAGDGRVNGRQVVSSRQLAAALQRDPADTGVSAGATDLRYNNGFWAYRSDLGGRCAEPVWIPFMSGYGGISVAIMPNGSVFYVFSDQGRFEWLQAAIASNTIRSFCN